MLKEKKIANSKSFDIVLSNLELFNSRKQSEVVLYFSNLDIPYTVQTNIAISKYYYQIEAYLQARQILDDDIIEIKKIDQKNLYELLRQRYYCNTKLYLLNKKEGKKYINESEYLQDFLKKSILKTNNENGLAQVYEDMGYFYSIQDDFGEAEYYYDLCKDIRLKMLGGKHSLMADLNLKYAYIFKKDDFDRAEKLYLEVIEIRENTKGFFHNHTATAYFNYAELLLKHKKYPKAFAYYEKCFKIREVTHSENHKDYVLCCFKLGSCLEKMGETNKAIEYFNRSKNN